MSSCPTTPRCASSGRRSARYAELLGQPTTGATSTTQRRRSGQARARARRPRRRRVVSASSAPYDDAPCRYRGFARSAEERVIAGVCAGIAQALAVDVTLVRLVFTLLALAGGAGILLYLALWLVQRSQQRPGGRARARAAGVAAAARGRPLRPRGRRGRARRGGAWRSSGAAAAASGRTRPRLSRALRLPAGVRCCCSRAAARRRRCSPPGAVAGALLLLVGPGSGGSHSSATPSARRGSAPRSAPRSPRASTTPCCRHSR